MTPSPELGHQSKTDNDDTSQKASNTTTTITSTVATNSCITTTTSSNSSNSTTSDRPILTTTTTAAATLDNDGDEVLFSTPSSQSTIVPEPQLATQFLLSGNISTQQTNTTVTNSVNSHQHRANKNLASASRQTKANLSQSTPVASGLIQGITTAGGNSATGFNYGAISPSTTVATIVNSGVTKSITTNSPSTITKTEEKTEELINTMPDDSFKKLLDEAMKYRFDNNARDKSETFNKLLKHTEEQDQEAESLFFKSQEKRHNQSGSLQNLSQKSDIFFDYDSWASGSAQKRSNRHRKYQSSVSSRQREGGSLPSNVNVSSSAAAPFMRETGGATRRSRATSGAAASAGDCDKNHSFDIGQFEERYLLASDSYLNPPDIHNDDSGTEMNTIKKLPRPTLNQNTFDANRVDITLAEIHSPQSNNSSFASSTTCTASSASPSSSTGSASVFSNVGGQPIPVVGVDQAISFSSFKNVDKTPVQLKNSYSAVESCVTAIKTNHDVAHANNHVILSESENCQPAYYMEQKAMDENGNSVQSSFTSSQAASSQQQGGPQTGKSKKRKKTENCVGYYTQNVDGHRGDDDIDKLVAYIEANQGGKNMLQNEAREKKKKNIAKKDGSKLKSNSMEELRSKSKLDEMAQNEDDKETSVGTAFSGSTMASNSVTMRPKPVKKSQQKADQKQRQQQNEHKRGERRSWGTEELSYLGDSSNVSKFESEKSNKIEIKDIKDVKEVKEKEKLKKPKEVVVPCDKQRNKKDDQSVSIVSIESISTSSETAEFHVVTKKKKIKKRPLEERMKHSTRDHPNHNVTRTKYHPSTQFTNDREIFLNANDSRRKSTSSVPPSEKSDTSDHDSVHSLPVESSSRLHTVPPVSTSSGSTPQASYADIAKFSNPEKSPDKWPSVNKTFNETTIQLTLPSNTTEDPSSPTATEQLKIVPTSVSYSQSLLDDNGNKQINMLTPEIIQKTPETVKSVAPTDNAKIVLQKSKSVDSDNNYCSIDQYPALEKTVKPPANKVAIQSTPAPAKQLNMASAKSPSDSVSAAAQTKKVMKQSTTCKSGLGQSNNAVIEVISKKAVSENEIALDDHTLPMVKEPEPQPMMIQPTKVYTQRKSSTGKREKHSSSSTSYYGDVNSSGKSMASRPAVIILHDNKNYGENASPLLFGDFNEEELRLWDQRDPHLNVDNANQLDSLASAEHEHTISALPRNKSTTSSTNVADAPKQTTLLPKAVSEYSVPKTSTSVQTGQIVIVGSDAYTSNHTKKGNGIMLEAPPTQQFVQISHVNKTDGASSMPPLQNSTNTKHPNNDPAITVLGPSKRSQSFAKSVNQSRYNQTVASGSNNTTSINAGSTQETASVFVAANAIGPINSNRTSASNNVHKILPAQVTSSVSSVVAASTAPAVVDATRSARCNQQTVIVVNSSSPSTLSSATPPTVRVPPSFNHDEIVTFIAHAWQDIAAECPELVAE